jgi:hypothetical protein
MWLDAIRCRTAAKSVNVVGLGGFQLRCKSQGILGAKTPFHLALWSARLLRPIATAACLGSMQLCNGDDLSS